MDPVKYIFEKPALTGRIARWQVLLFEFDIIYVTQKAIKGSTLANYLAQQHLNVKLFKVYTDLALVIHQLKGEWETRDHKLIPYQTYLKKLAEFFDEVPFHHVPR